MPLIVFRLILRVIPMKESSFQHDLIKRIHERLPGCLVLKNDPTYLQGIPDLLVLYKTRWAALECKRGKNEHRQPNQEYYVSMLNDMSYSSFVYPENREEVLNAMECALRT